MRRTITLDDDVAIRLEQFRRERGLTFRQAINDILRAGLAESRAAGPYTLPTYNMGPPLVDLTKALQLAAEIEDQKIIRKLRLGEFSFRTSTCCSTTRTVATRRSGRLNMGCSPDVPDALLRDAAYPIFTFGPATIDLRAGKPRARTGPAPEGAAVRGTLAPVDLSARVCGRGEDLVCTDRDTAHPGRPRTRSPA